MTWEIIEYKKTNGKCPVGEFLDSLNPKDYSKILRSLLLLEEFGLLIGGPLIKHLEDGIWELRVKQSSNIQRILLFHWYKNKIVLTNGFTKKSNKTPSAEIKRAKNYRIDHVQRIEVFQ